MTGYFIQAAVVGVTFFHPPPRQFRTLSSLWCVWSCCCICHLCSFAPLLWIDIIIAVLEYHFIYMWSLCFGSIIVVNVSNHPNHFLNNEHWEYLFFFFHYYWIVFGFLSILYRFICINCFNLYNCGTNKTFFIVHPPKHSLCCTADLNEFFVNYRFKS